MTFKELFLTFNLENLGIIKGLEDMECEFIYKRESDLFLIYIFTDKVISYHKINRIRSYLEEKLYPQIHRIVIITKITNVNPKKINTLMKKYWPNILYTILNRCPSTIAYQNDVENLFMDNLLKIKVPNMFLYDRFCSINMDDIIKTQVYEELGIEIDVLLEVAKQSSEEKNSLEIDKILKRQSTELKKIINNITISNICNDDISDKKVVMVEENKEKNSINRGLEKDVFYGRDVFAKKVDINKLTDNMGTVLVEGVIFFTEKKEGSYGKIRYNFYITDNTSAILARINLNDSNKDIVEKHCEIGNHLIVKGDIKRNSYTSDIELYVTGMKLVNNKNKEDEIDKNSEERVELHLHTQMSAMDSVLPTKVAINTAISWGHKAIGITDHGVVQAFPDAMNASKGKDIKVLYGSELYVVDDSQEIIVNPNDEDFNQRFVVFDIETTGFSPINDNITEIGAVLIENCSIVDRFSTFVDPEMDISYTVQELTRITNETVKGAPKQEEALTKFMEFCKDAILVAHNADFDTGFISEKCKKYDIEYNHEKIDTLLLSRVLLTKLKKFSLDKVCKELNIVLSGHHRAVNDAEATAKVFLKYIDMMKKNGAEVLSDVNKIYGRVDYKKLRPTHAIVYARNQDGLKTLYKIISDGHINHFYKTPRTLRSILEENKENLIIGSACSNGEIFNAIMRNKSEDEIRRLIGLYDYIEVMPLDNNIHLIKGGEIKDKEELIDINKRLIELGDRYNIPVVATGDVHMLAPYEYIYRDILKYSQGFSKLESNKSLYFRTTKEMLSEFDYIDSDKAYEIVVKNSNKIADMIEDIKPIPSETYPPIIEGSEEELRRMCFEKAERIYGSPLPEVVESRLNKELNSIIGNGYAVMYIIAHKLVAKSLSEGYLVGSRGSVGSSLAATMSDITEVNPLPAHYICPNQDCKHSEFFKIGEWGSGIDLPDKNCEKCGTKMIKDGHDIPFEVFLGFEGDKEPDIDLNFSGEYQSEIHKYTEELFGKGYTYRAGTIGTVKDKTAFGYVKKFSEETEADYTNAEMKWLSYGCTGVKKTSGQHPGGVMVIPDYKDVYDFTPIQYPANDVNSGVQTTHFDYHSISGRILKLDILGHDGPTILKMLEDFTGIDVTEIPLDDKETMSLFLNTEALNVSPEEIGSPVGSLAIPEFGTKFTRQMLVDTQPTTFAELVRIAGLSHGTDVWLNNAQDLVRNNIVGLKEVISTRDDIMNYLIFSNLNPKMAFTIMESVRKGKGLKPEHEEAMIENNVPSWYIDSCKKIKYMFPKAHAVAYVMTSFRIAYCKVHYPEAFYATYFTTKVEDFDIELVTSGIENVKKRMDDIAKLGNKATAKEKNQYTILEVVVEMYARNIEFLKVDIYKSHPSKFLITEDKKILPPMISLQGMGENAAESIVEAREDGEFISKEDLLRRTKLSKTVLDKLSAHGSLDGMSETNQISFFN